VLRFLDGDLVAIDYLTVSGIDGGFSLERRLVDSHHPVTPPSNEDVPGPRPPPG
jgi:hypothetical protein